MKIGIAGVALAALLLTVTAGCGSEAEAPSETPSEAAEPVPTETTVEPSGPPEYALGETADFAGEDGGEFNVTLLEYKKDQPDDDSVEGGERLDTLLLKACNVSFDDDANDSDLGDILAFENIQLGDADSGSYIELDLAPSPAPKPQLDTFAVLGKGQCMKGWMAFAVPEETQMVSAAYANSGEILARWTL